MFPSFALHLEDARVDLLPDIPRDETQAARAARHLASRRKRRGQRDKTRRARTKESQVT